MWAKLKAWWYSRVQQHIGTLLGGFAFTDLVTELAGARNEITTLIGAKWYAVLRVLGAIAIVWRARQVK